MTIVGLERKQGKYQGREYDNMVITCLLPYPEEKQAEGSFAETIKVKTALFEEYDFTLGDEITALYNKFGQVVELVRKE